MKIVIFDPYVREVGHFRYFNWHIAKLFDVKANEIIFADWNGKFTEWYKNKNLQSASIRIISIEDSKQKKCYFKSLHKGITRYIEEYKLFKRLFSKIEEMNPDVLFLSSLGESGLSLIRNIKMPILVVIHSLIRISLNYKFKERPSVWLKQKLVNKSNRNFIKKNSAGVIVLESTLENTVNNLDYDILRIPYELFDENTLDSSAGLDKLESQFTISTLGCIYKGKNIEFVLKVIEDIDSLFFKYRLCGKTSGDYGESIKRISATISNRVETCFGYLSDKKYEEEFLRTHFVVIPYQNTRKYQASGIFFDSMKYNRPVIVPDFEPFKSYINKYKIGLVYKEGDRNSFINAVKEAKKLGTNHFIDNIKQFKRDHTYTKWRPTFLSFVDKIIKNKGGTI